MFVLAKRQHERHCSGSHLFSWAFAQANLSNLHEGLAIRERQMGLICRLHLCGDRLMQAFDLGAVLQERERADQTWLEFLRVPGLSMGVYHLKVGQPDPQKPHEEDEVYYIVSGRGRFRAGAAVRDAAPGTILFVARREEHRFFDVTEDLTVVVFFAPAEGSLRVPAPPDHV
jgi:mannose-6-phosphate isomerase-like protein (cupin superfamily)